MKKTKAGILEDELRPEYSRQDFGNMVRGKYARRFSEEASNLVMIDPELHKAFPNARAVNDALRGLLELARRVPRVRSKSAAS